MRISMQNVVLWAGAQGPTDGMVEGWSIDSRSVHPGDLFFALHGPTHDGHDFVEDVWKRSAVAMVDRPIPEGGAFLQVDETTRALQRLARQARRSWGGRVVGVTGSAGKTTTKDVIAHLLMSAIAVGKTIGNFNNHVGLPLSVLRLPDDCRAAVLEMGMNHAGEIEQLCTIAEPDIAVITNVGYAHVEFFRSIEGVALAKRELIEALRPGGVAVLNADDQRVAKFASVHRGRTVTYGFSEEADFRANEVHLNAQGSYFRCRGVAFESPLTGQHGVLNALAGLATASLFDIDPRSLTESVKTIPISKMRGERIERNGLTILNDSYNANPEAMRAMLDVLATVPARRRVAVLGEMLELGAQSESLHRALGTAAARDGVDLLVGIRGSAQSMVESARAEGMSPDAAVFFNTSGEAGEALREMLQPGDAVLFKGSRGVRVEQALEKLLEERS